MRTRNGCSLNRLVATSTDRTAIASTNAMSGVLGMAAIISGTKEREIANRKRSDEVWKPGTGSRSRRSTGEREEEAERQRHAVHHRVNTTACPRRTAIPT
jgi:hypothetical protein